jgi:hypothetical protein
VTLVFPFAKKPAAFDDERGAISLSLGGDLRAHLGQRLDDARHGAARKRGVADEPAAEGLPREDAGEQAHRGAGVAAIDVAFRCGENAFAAMHDDGDAAAALGRVGGLDLDAERPQRGHRAQAILAREEARDDARAVRQRGENERPVRDALVAGDFDFSVQRGCPPDFPVSHLVN